MACVSQGNSLLLAAQSWQLWRLVATALQQDTMLQHKEGAAKSLA
jgi:hypothetical protein